MSNQNLVFGFETNCVRDIRDSLQVASSSHANFVIVPLFHPRFRRDTNNISKQRLGPGSRSDRELECKDWVANVVGKISDWISLDSIHFNIRKNSEEVLRQELSWAVHLGLQAILLPSPCLKSTNYARCILQHFSPTSYQQLWVRIPLLQPLRSENNHVTHSYCNNNTHVNLKTSIPSTNTTTNNNNNTADDGWHAWNSFRTLTGHVHYIAIAIEFSSEINAEDMSSGLFDKWIAEPIKSIILPTNMFIFNKAGYPVLSRIHQSLLCMFLKQHKVQIIFKGPPRHCLETSLYSSSYSSYIQYINHIYLKLMSELSVDEIAIQNYRDRLQTPLQPLMDNLESQTYETFESDNIKYVLYEKAIEKAIRVFQQRQKSSSSSSSSSSVVAAVVDTIVLTDNSSNTAMAIADMSQMNDDINDVNNKFEIENGSSNSSSSSSQSIPIHSSDTNIVIESSSSSSNGHEKQEDMHFNQSDQQKEEDQETLIITVVGAGRGPLVAAAISAASATQQPLSHLRIYAIEKNENAIITLRNRIISERWMNIVTVIHSDMRNYQPPELCDILVSELLGSWGDNELSPECLDGALKCVKPLTGMSIPSEYSSYLSPISCTRLWMGVRDMPLNQLHVKTYLDSPFVVKLHNFYQIASSQKLFTFVHTDFTKTPQQIDNSRSHTVSFVSSADTLLHGFSGTFLAYLFKDRSSNNDHTTTSSSSSSSSSSSDGSNNGNKNNRNNNIDYTTTNNDHTSITLSTVHEMPTPTMQSWFPLFLPLSTPILIKKDDIITIHVWRCVTVYKVWYEWCLSSPICTSIQNSGGKSYFIGL